MLGDIKIGLLVVVGGMTVMGSVWLYVLSLKEYIKDLTLDLRLSENQVEIQKGATKFETKQLEASEARVVELVDILTALKDGDSYSVVGTCAHLNTQV